MIVIQSISFESVTQPQANWGVNTSEVVTDFVCNLGLRMPASVAGYYNGLHPEKNTLADFVARMVPHMTADEVNTILTAAVAKRMA